MQALYVVESSKPVQNCDIGVTPSKTFTVSWRKRSRFHQILFPPQNPAYQSSSNASINIVAICLVYCPWRARYRSHQGSISRPARAYQISCNASTDVSVQIYPVLWQGLYSKIIPAPSYVFICVRSWHNQHCAIWRSLSCAAVAMVPRQYQTQPRQGHV